MLLPTVLVLLALLVQPACVFYTRAVMAGTASELARLAVTSECDEDEVEAYALRRLAAVPDVSVFHEGGPDDWEIAVEGPDDAGTVSVTIEGSVRPLPLFGSIVSALGTAEDGCVRLSVSTEASMRSTWIGGSYEEWVKIWG